MTHPNADPDAGPGRAHAWVERFALRPAALAVSAFLLVLAAHPGEAQAEPAGPVAFETSAVADQDLSEIRGGFLTVDGIQIDLSFVMNTTMDDGTVVASRITLDDLMSGRLGVVSVNGVESLGQGQIFVGEDGVGTEILHIVDPSNTLMVSVNNTASNRQIMTTGTVTAEIFMPNRIRAGLPIRSFGPTNLEMRQAIISSLAR